MRRNKLLILALLLLPAAARAEPDDVLRPVVNAQINSPREALRTQLFGEGAGHAGCKTLLPDPKGGFASVDKELDFVIRTIVESLKTKNDKALQPLFHQRLNTSLVAINDTYGRMDLTDGKNQNISVYRLWALNTVDGSPVGVKCDANQEKAFGLYGYPLQFGLWIQAQGPKEVSRIFIHIVPADGRWNIGSFHLHQWTHGGMDWEAWSKEGLKASGAGHKESAFVFYDFAAKLLDAGNHLELPVREDALKARDAQTTPEKWDRTIRDLLKDWKVIYTASILVPEGAGILVRQVVPGEVSVEHIQNTCAAMALKLAKSAWATDLAGIRCGFNLPREAPNDEGILGSIFTSYEDAKKVAEKAEKQKK